MPPILDTFCGRTDLALRFKREALCF
jgi:hypothetical protein